MNQNRFFSVLFDFFYSSSQYNKGQSLKESEELFQTLLNFMKSLLKHDLKSQNHQIFQSNIYKLKNVPSLSHCFENINNQDLNGIISNILQETSLLYNYLVCSLSLLLSLCENSADNTKEDKINTIYSRIKHSRELFEESSKMKFIDPNELARVDLKDSLPAIISIYNEQISALNDERNKFMDDLREQHHMCIVCRKKPAVYFATPCLHPCFCTSCINEFVKQKFTYSRCLNCKEVVKGVEPLSFLANASTYV